MQLDQQFIHEHKNNTLQKMTEHNTNVISNENFDDNLENNLEKALTDHELTQISGKPPILPPHHQISKDKLMTLEAESQLGEMMSPEAIIPAGTRTTSKSSSKNIEKFKKMSVFHSQSLPLANSFSIHQSESQAYPSEELQAPEYFRHSSHPDHHNYNV